MAKYCYNCGHLAETGKYCTYCGTDTHPPRDVYFTQIECGNCDALLPRWANYCPKCGKEFGFTPPTDPKLAAKRNKGLVAGAVFFSVVSVVFALVLALAEEAIPVQYALLGAAAFCLVIWIITAIRWERGQGQILSVHQNLSKIIGDNGMKNNF